MSIILRLIIPALLFCAGAFALIATIIYVLALRMRWKKEQQA